jgi:hypothetical protein
MNTRCRMLNFSEVEIDDVYITSQPSNDQKKHGTSSGLVYVRVRHFFVFLIFQDLASSSAILQFQTRTRVLFDKVNI